MKTSQKSPRKAARVLKVRAIIPSIFRFLFSRHREYFLSALRRKNFAMARVMKLITKSTSAR